MLTSTSSDVIQKPEIFMSTSSMIVNLMLVAGNFGDHGRLWGPTHYVFSLSLILAVSWIHVSKISVYKTYGLMRTPWRHLYGVPFVPNCSQPVHVGIWNMKPGNSESQTQTWLWYVDNVFAIQEYGSSTLKPSMHDHLKSQHPAIHFTCVQTNFGSIGFMKPCWYLYFATQMTRGIVINRAVILVVESTLIIGVSIIIIGLLGQ